MAVQQLRTRKLTIIAQDPSVLVDGKILRTQVEIPAEELHPGPWGYRVQTLDYDSSTGTLYQPRKYPALTDGVNEDPYRAASVSTMTGKHGKAASKTEVPRKTLVEALQSEGEFHTTQDLKRKDISFACEVKF